MPTQLFGGSYYSYIPGLEPVEDSGFSIQDIGDTGWTIPTLEPTAVSGLPATYMDAAQVGSRIYYIDADNGEDPNDGGANPGEVYWWNGTNIIDETGSTTGDGGVPYGTNPLNPSGPIKPFRRWGYVGPRNSSGDIGSAAGNHYIIGAINGGPWFRAQKPDWWLFKRGVTHSIYESIRTFLDDEGRTTQQMWGSSVLRTTGGASDTAVSVIGAYGDHETEGRAHIIDSCYGFIGNFGGASHTMAHTVIFGMMFDSHKNYRQPKIRPVDWPNWSANDIGCFGVRLQSMTQAQDNILFEDIHAHGNGIGADFSSTHSAMGEGVSFRRCIISNAWDDTSTRHVEARKGAGEADQTVAGNSTVTITWPTETSDTGGMFASNAFTGVNGGKYKLWVLCDVTGTIAAAPTGSLEVVLYVNGVEVDSGSVDLVNDLAPGSSNTWQVSKVLYTGQLGGAHACDVRLRSTGVTGNLTITGNNTARLLVHSIAGGFKPAGFGIQTRGPAYWKLEDSILIRNGHCAEPTETSSFSPDGTDPQYIWNALHHNFYNIGNNDEDYGDMINCVSILGAAGDIVNRGRINLQKSFFYTGYVEIRPEHNNDVFTAKMGEVTDTVMQKFYAAGGAHPAWGFMLASGLKDFEFKRNIVTSTMVNTATTNDSFAVKVFCNSTPYYQPHYMKYVQPTSGTVIQGNILDAFGSATPTLYNEAIIESNGSQIIASGWSSPITGWTTASTAGTVLTCTPAAGYSLADRKTVVSAAGINTTNHGFMRGSTITQGANTATVVGFELTSGEIGSTNTGILYHTTPTPGAFVAGAATVGSDTMTFAGADSAVAAPEYQWHRYTTTSSDVKFPIVGAQSATYTISEDACTFTNGSANIGVPDASLYRVGQAVAFRNSGGALPTNFSPYTTGNGTNYIVASVNTGANTISVGVTAGSAGSGSHFVSQDFTYDAPTMAGNYYRVGCLVSGITYPAGQGLTGTVCTDNEVATSLASPTSYHVMGRTALPATIANPSINWSAPLTSDISYNGTNTTYATRAAQTTASGGTNADASLATYLTSLGVSVAYSNLGVVDGAYEYDQIVIGANPKLTAMRWGQWDDRLLGRQIGNHIRTGRGMATVA